MNKVTAIIGILLMVAVPSLADEIEIPFAINKNAYIQEALEKGLDLTDGDNAHGFIDNRGSRFIVCTYRTATIEQLELIKNLTWKHLRK